jgi:hypothetical protein
VEVVLLVIGDDPLWFVPRLLARPLSPRIRRQTADFDDSG